MENENKLPGLTEALAYRLDHPDHVNGHSIWKPVDPVAANWVSVHVPQEVEASIAAEARAPLEAELEKARRDARSFETGKHEATRLLWDEAVPDRDRWKARAEDAERKLEEIRETLTLIASWPVTPGRAGISQALHEVFEIAERALTPPASTAAEETTDV